MTKESKDKKGRPPVDMLEELDEDVFKMPIHLVEEELGPNHAQLGKQGLGLIRQLSREHKKASLRRQAEQNQNRFHRKRKRAATWIRDRARQLLDEGHPGLSAAVSFRGRSPEAMTDEELLSIAEDQALAELFERADDD